MKPGVKGLLSPAFERTLVAPKLHPARFPARGFMTTMIPQRCNEESDLRRGGCLSVPTRIFGSRAVHVNFHTLLISVGKKLHVCQADLALALPVSLLAQ
eukprot:1156894-Pelagomonas_calceolata.AAC.13